MCDIWDNIQVIASSHQNVELSKIFFFCLSIYQYFPIFFSHFSQMPWKNIEITLLTVVLSVTFKMENLLDSNLVLFFFFFKEICKSNGYGLSHTFQYLIWRMFNILLILFYIWISYQIDGDKLPWDREHRKSPILSVFLRPVLHKTSCVTLRKNKKESERILSSTTFCKTTWSRIEEAFGVGKFQSSSADG